MDPADRKQKIRLFIFASAALLAAAGIFLRCQGLDRFLEYDEIWTFRFYAPLPWHEIFTDLATPNNHCLNSLLIKWLCALFSPSAALIRLPALVTKAGPLRVYLPLYAPLTVSGAAALTVLCRAMRRPRWILPAGLLVSLFPLAVFPEDMEKIEPPGSEHIAARVMAETPKNVIIVYRRGDELPVLFNSPEAAPDMMERLRNPAGLSGLLVMGRNDVLEVFDAHGRNADVPLKGCAYEELPPESGIPLFFFKLEPLTKDVDLSSSGPLLMNVQSHARCEAVLQRGEWLRISAALTAGFRADEQDRAGLYLCEKPLLTAPECLTLEEQTGGRIRFYRFRKTSATGGSKP